MLHHSEAAKCREMEHELDKLAARHQSELQEVKCHHKDQMAQEQQKIMHMEMAMDRGENNSVLPK